MPLMKYFSFVGSALVLWLLVMNWLQPEPNAEPVRGSINKPVIRISSVETLPAKVVFDTSMPYMPPPPGGTGVTLQEPQSAFAFAQITPGPLPTFSFVAEVTPKKPIAKKRASEKRLATNRVARKAPNALKNYPVREAEHVTRPPIRTTLLDHIAGRFGEMFNVN